MTPKPLPPPPECAQCGATLSRQARACPECGADERTGWREADVYDGLDLPEEAWQDTPDTVQPMSTKRRLPWYWIATTLVCLITLLSILVGR